MISKKDIKKAAKKIFKRQRGLRDHQMIHPQREWLVGLVLGGVILVSGAAWSATTYVAVDERDIDSTNNSETGQNVYREDIVEFALDEFRTREENYNVLLSQGAAIPTSETPEENDPEEVSEAEPGLEEPTATSTEPVSEEEPAPAENDPEENQAVEPEEIERPENGDIQPSF